MQTRKDSIRQAILAEARKEFALFGYDKASMKVIASNCGVSVGTAYKYFGSKQGLFEALAAPAKEALPAMLRANDTAEFYTAFNDARSELRLLLFKGLGHEITADSHAPRVSPLGCKMCARWLYHLLEELLLHRHTREEADALIAEFISMKKSLPHTS